MIHGRALQQTEIVNRFGNEIVILVTLENPGMPHGNPGGCQIRHDNIGSDAPSEADAKDALVPQTPSRGRRARRLASIGPKRWDTLKITG